MKNYLLTDFPSNRWKGIKLESISNLIEELNSNNKCLYGEIGNPSDFDVLMENVSHIIKNLTYIEFNLILHKILFLILLIKSVLY